MVFDGCFELAIGNIEWFDHFSSQFWTKIASVIFLFGQFQLLIHVILFKSQTKKKLNLKNQIQLSVFLTMFYIH